MRTSNQLRVMPGNGENEAEGKDEGASWVRLSESGDVDAWKRSESGEEASLTICSNEDGPWGEE